MTEAEWLTCADLRPLRTFMFRSGRRLSSRKWKLFEIGCCRQVWHFITDAKCRRAIEAAEMKADGLASNYDLLASSLRRPGWRKPCDNDRQISVYFGGRR